MKAKQPKRTKVWSFLETSREILKKQPTKPGEEEDITHKQGDDLGEAEPNIQDVLSSKNILK
ncbi:hypothetical protein [Legionella fallonii]|uniref:Uncharacterized protein n=1 Tax=Legionella fallonii LLAP-10 TaxID=1212491 RepID=A0A098G4X3_9GAMM|nr:hypothetical protein [Legionella fallonii]CEG57517.1 protein of unknown function [Legionella fallonii LLAP-10]